MKTETFHMIGNAHLDPVWLWQWQEGFQETKATFRSVLDRMNEYDDFIFTSSSAAMYEWVEENNPEMFEEIRQRIKEGRWRIVGGWWIQPDCNIPGGESFVRQGLYGQRYFQEKFGVTAKVGYNVDSFGHHGMLPQILKKSGMDAYVFMRPMPNEKGLPGRLFWWESDDGSRVLAFRIMYEYLSWGKELERYVQRCKSEFKGSVDELMLFYGVGNHGGGPTKENIESIYKLKQDPNIADLVFSTPETYFEKMKDKENLPVVHDDLQHHASGCYAAHSSVKQWNRQAENRLIAAEKYSALASWVTGQPYPADFNRAWKDVLFNQFHDILAGTSIEPAYEDARNLYGEALTIADRALNHAVQSISWNIDIEQDERMKPIVVFNPHAWESRVNVEVEIGGIKDTSVLVDENRQAIPFQTVQSQATANGRFRLSFMAELPPMGYRVYKLYSELNSVKRVGQPIKATQLTMENDRFRIEFNAETGWINSLYDKHAEHEVFSNQAAKPIVINDKTDTWSHEVLHFNEVVGTFKAKKVYLAEHGPVKSVIRVVSEYGKSTLVQDFMMYPGSDQIDVKVSVDWRETFKMLKLLFPVNAIFTKQTYEIPYGTIEREHNGEEEPGQSWVDVTGLMPNHKVVYGVSLMNDAKYSYSIHNKELALTVLRSPIYAHHDPLVPDEDCDYTFIDQGIQRFHYSLLPHEGSWEEAGTTKRAAELNCMPISIIETYHKGPLPQIDSYVKVDAENIIVSALKKAEDNDDLIIRLYETNRIETEVEIHLPKLGRSFRTRFKSCEIKTFRIPKDSNVDVKETNLIEWDEE
ncbi:alpha-mannosidase [Fictibacillus terranigra]|uniref:Glycoside hydrolase family 38 C-terminal domain-containing protein n=1 Tax=Fictibacillus terranigra TaxID=3058424 RepID=A0ABT8E520_9BACL|nr:alpha-mannosidase [Fictibacillus sp. CENA-BCM004]MDN4072995.1 glycoside hydrolase family 38 C-terminal domain-containing protein [Fictibacillus sp. CENA-BCM004]